MKNKGKNIDVIIQAGGRGSRLRHYTWNKPKCLVSHNGKPLIYHLFDYLIDANFHIIADYQVNKIKKYFLISPPKINYKIYNAKETGTCSGIKDVIKNVDKKNKIILVWSDLIIKDLPNIQKTPAIITTSSFMCFGSGSCTIKPSRVVSLFNLLMVSISSFSETVSSKRINDESKPIFSQERTLLPT